MFNLNLIIDDEPIEIGRFTTKEKAKKAYEYLLSREDLGYEPDELEIFELDIDINELVIDGEYIGF